MMEIILYIVIAVALLMVLYFFLKAALMAFLITLMIKRDEIESITREARKLTRGQ